MRHASIPTIMNIYGKAMTNGKRQAHSKIVELILKPKKTAESSGTIDTTSPVGA